MVPKIRSNKINALALPFRLVLHIEETRQRRLQQQISRADLQEQIGKNLVKATSRVQSPWETV